MSKLVIKDKLRKYINSLNRRERRLLVLMVVIGCLMFLNAVVPSLGDLNSIFVSQNERLEKAKKAIEQSERIVQKYLNLKEKQALIEKKFEKNEGKEGHLSYVDSLKTPDMFDFAIGAQQDKEFGKDFNQITFKINFKASSLATVMNFIKKLENEKRRYLISELSIKKAYGSFTVVIEVNSIERKKG